MLKVSEGVYSFPDLSQQSFHGLPGLLSDSLPDKFGNKVIAAYLRSRKLNPEDLTSAVADWPRFAAEAEVKDEFVGKIGRVLAV